jgi:NAD(P)-dependent dehydrogenase (short-subunit alcohol dehydrogenase family)
MVEVLGGKTAVVTGAASGMGRAMAERFGRAGMRVVAADVEEAALDAAVAGLVASGVEAIGVVTDVSEGEANAVLAATAVERFGAVHVVCLNAGVGGPTNVTLPDLTEDDWAWVLGVNLWGPIHGTRVFLPRLLEQGEGHIVYTASIAGLVPGTLGPYSVAKHGVVSLATGVQAYLAVAGSSVGVSLLCPGFVATQILESGRNRPARWRDVGKADDSDETRMAREALEALIAGGTPPSAVADLVHDAVVANQFFVYTDDVFMPAVKQFHAEIEQGRNPQLFDLTADTDA